MGTKFIKDVKVSEKTHKRLHSIKLNKKAHYKKFESIDAVISYMLNHIKWNR